MKKFYRFIVSDSPITWILILLLTSLLLNQIPKQSAYYEHYYFLSKSLLKGNLDVTDELINHFDSFEKQQLIFDYAQYQDRYYLHLGLFPAIFGLPLLPLGINFYSTAQLIFFLLLTLYSFQKMTKYFLKQKMLLNSVLLFIASPLLTSIVWRGPWYLSSLIVCSLGLFFLWTYQVQNKKWGIFVLLPLFLTRPTTVFYFLLPILNVIKEKKPSGKEIKTVLLTITIALVIFAGYNYLRFNNMVESGYHFLKVPMEKYKEIRNMENVFSLNHLLSNFIYLFVNPPRPILNEALRFTFPFFELSRFGVGLLWVIPWAIPYFLYLSKKQVKKDWPYLVTIVLIALSILSFGGEGSFQIGPRYSLDFLPILIFVNFKWLGKNKKFYPVFRKLLFLGVILNLYFFCLVQLGHINRI